MSAGCKQANEWIPPKYTHPVRDEQGRIIIRMSVKDDNDFLSPFSATDTPVISMQVADFIEHSTSHFHPGEQYVLQIRSSCIDEDERTLYRNAIQEYYTQQYITNERELKHTRRLAWGLGAAGLVVLAIAVFLEHSITSMVWAEFVDIIAWVLLWEGTYIELFDNRKRRLRRKSYLSYRSMDIQFHSV